MAAANELEVLCPAGEFIGETDDGPSCRCAIEMEVIGARSNPSSLVNFCMGEYIDCPTWRAEKERIWAKRRQPLAVGGPK